MTNRKPYDEILAVSYFYGKQLTWFLVYISKNMNPILHKILGRECFIQSVDTKVPGTGSP